MTAAVDTAALTIRVVGHEPVQQGSMVGREVGKGSQRRIVVVHQDGPELRAWRREIGKAADSAIRALGRPWLPFTEAVEVTAFVYRTRGATVTRELPSVPPDVDKYSRAILDALEQAAVIKNDAIVTDTIVRKRYADGRPPGATIRVRPMTGVLL